MLGDGNMFSLSLAGRCRPFGRSFRGSAEVPFSVTSDSVALAFSGRPVDEIDSVVELFVW